MDNSDYMGMNMPTGNSPVDDTEPNKEVIEQEQAEKTQVQLAYSTVREILQSERETVMSIADLPKVKTLTQDELVAQGFETELRRRYTNLLDNLMSRFELREEK